MSIFQGGGISLQIVQGMPLTDLDQDTRRKSISSGFRVSGEASVPDRNWCFEFNSGSL